MKVRLETRPAVGVHLDLAFSRPDMGRTTAVELKYLTRLWSGIVGGERYELKNHGAQDIRAYDIVALPLPLELAGRYELRWSDYSTLPLGGPGRNFRKLVVRVVPAR